MELEFIGSGVYAHIGALTDEFVLNMLPSIMTRDNRCIHQFTARHLIYTIAKPVFYYRWWSSDREDEN